LAGRRCGAAWYREGALRVQVTSNEHSPVKYRCNGVVRNVDPWYDVYSVKPRRQDVSEAGRPRAHLVSASMNIRTPEAMPPAFYWKTRSKS
jgi:hypothetical protein